MSDLTPVLARTPATRIEDVVARMTEIDGALLAGMNAHINRDLPVALIETFAAAGSGASLPRQSVPVTASAFPDSAQEPVCHSRITVVTFVLRRVIASTV
jgi:hypothetical protein